MTGSACRYPGVIAAAWLLGWCLRLATSKLDWNYWKSWAKFNFSMQSDSICQEPTCFSHLGLHVLHSPFSEMICIQGLQLHPWNVDEQTGTLWTHANPLRALSSCSPPALVGGNLFAIINQLSKPHKHCNNIHSNPIYSINIFFLRNQLWVLSKTKWMWEQP